MTEEIKEKYKGFCCIEFSGEDCGACRSLMPVLQEVIGARDDIRLEHIEVEEKNKDLVNGFNVDRVPTILLTEDGEEFARCHGFQPEEILELWIDAKLEERKKK